MAGNDFWQSMVIAAKDKTAEVLEFVKKDIDELSSTLSSEILHYSDVLKRRASNIVGNVKDTLNFNGAPMPRFRRISVSSYLKNLWRPETVTDDVCPMIIRNSEPVPMTEVQYKHHVLVTDPKNFTECFSEEEQREVDAWYATADGNLHDLDYLRKLLTQCPSLADMYRTLVPDQVSHSEFWKRYFYRHYVIFNGYPEDEIGNISVATDDSCLLGEDVVLLDVNEDSDKIETTEDELSSIEIGDPYFPSSSRCETDDWNMEYEIERIKEMDDSSLSDIILAN